MKSKYLLYYINTQCLQYYRVVELKGDELIELEFSNIELTRKQYLLLYHLCNRKTEYIELGVLLAKLNEYPETEKVDFTSPYHEFLYHSFRVHLCTLRKKLKETGLVIETNKKRFRILSISKD